VLAMENKTSYDASVSLFAENSLQATKAMGYTEFLNWPKLSVRAGERIQVLVKKDGKIMFL
jgi:hypothetical protein